MMSKGSYLSLISEITKSEIAKLVSQEPKEIPGLFRVPKEGEERGFLFATRCANMHFTVPEAPECPYRGYLQQMALIKRETF